MWPAISHSSDGFVMSRLHRVVGRVVILALLAGLPGVVAASPASDPVVDFSRQRVRVWGLGGQPWEFRPSLEEERARAWMSAVHRGYEEILHIPLMEGYLVRHAIQMNPALKERLGLILLSTQPIFHEADATGLVRCQLDVPFSGATSLRSALYLAALRPEPMEPESFLASWAVSPLLEASALDDAKSEMPYERVALDLRRFPFLPSLFPRFFSEQGRLLFQEAMLPQPVRFSRPMVTYVESAAALWEGVPPEKILTVRAVVPAGKRCDVRIAQPEVENFLRFCRHLVRSPNDAGDIRILYTPRPELLGRMPAAESDKKSDKKTDKKTSSGK